VALAICLGATIVYQRAKAEKLIDVHRHLGEIASRLSKSSISPMRSDALDALVGSLRTVRDTAAEVRRIYTFALEDAEQQTRLDTGYVKEASGSRPLPPHARQARAHFREIANAVKDASWSVVEDTNATVFSLVFDDHSRPTGILAVEADADQLLIGLSTIRQALWFTCFLGGTVGIGAGMVVWHLRRRAAAAQWQLRESRHIEEAVIASLGEVVYTYNPEEARFRWRGNIHTLLGLTSDYGGGGLDAWVERLHPDDRSRYLMTLEAAAANSQPMSLEYRVRSDTAGTVWVLDRAQPVHFEDGRSHLTGALIDLTTQRRAEEALRIFFEGTAMAHLAFDGDTIVDANPAAVELFGAPDKETLLTRQGWMLWPRRQAGSMLSAQEWSERVMSAVEAGSARFEWQFLRFDGSAIECDVFVRPTIFQDREVLMVGCLDISTARRAQARLIESEQRFRDVSEAIGEFIWEVDRHSRYTYASSRVKDVLGLDPAEVLGHTPFEFLPAEDVEAVKERSDAIFREGLPFRNFEHRVRQPDGSMLWISVSGVPSYDATGQITGYRGASLDITKHRAYEQELVLQKDAAEAAARAKSNFLAMMSHEIRTPLNSVLGFADLLLDTPLNPTQRDYLQTVRGSGGALLVLLNDILDFSKIESGQMEIEIRPTDLRGSVQEVLDLHRPGANAKELDLSLHMAADVPARILTDPSRLRQILLNLVGNAVKFTAAGSVRIDISRRAIDGTESLRILVADTGIGISREQQERLFKPFIQADSSTTRRFGGTGLGLAISKRLANLLGGELGLLEHNGPGAQFFFDLPIDVSTEESPISASSQSVAKKFLDGAQLRIARRAPWVLVVDDNTLNRRLTSKLLHQLGAETDTAASAEECFEKVSITAFDFVLMDVQMPGMDGLEATRHIRDLETRTGRKPLVIIALTADAMVGDRERCLAAGMNEYLTKPLRRESLVRVLDSYRDEAPA